MKPAALFLTASLLANGALVAAFLLRPTTPAPTTARPSAAKASPGSADALRAALAAGDAATLAAAGFPPEAVRELTLGRAMLRALERSRVAKGPADGRWWRSGRANPLAAREQQLQVRREFSEALAAAGLEDPGLFAAGDASQQLAFLSPEKRAALRRVTQDYEEMMLKFGAGGIQLASDRERLKLLRAERDRDIAALLSPAELEAYELRTSASSAAVRARYGDAIESEDDFRRIYALQKAFDEKYPVDALGGRVTPETLRERNEAQRQFQEQLRAAVGDEKYAALQRANDFDLRNVESLASRLQLPTTTADRVATSREALAAESQRINADTSLTFAQRREQIQTLGAKAKSELTQTLGQEAADAYAQRSPWLGMLQNGMAYGTPQTGSGSSLGSAGGSSVYPVPPASANSGGSRQSFTVSAPLNPVDLTGIVEGLPVGAVEGSRVMTFSTSSATNDPTAAPGATSGGGTRTITVPKPDPAQTTQPKP